MKYSTMIFASLITTLATSTAALANVTCSVGTPTQAGASWDVLCSDDGDGNTTRYWCNVSIAITTADSAGDATLAVNGNVPANQQNVGIWFGAMYQDDPITNVTLGDVDCDAQDDGN